jgi:hypothetical protein
MTKYDIIIEGVEDGLTKNTVKQLAEDFYPDAERVEVVASEARD